MKRKRGLPSYPGSRVLYVVLTIISMLEALVLLHKRCFSASYYVFISGEAVQSMLNETVYFGITFAVRHLLVLECHKY